MRKRLLVLLLLAGGTLAAQVSLGIRIGPPPRPRVVRIQPIRPGPDFTWIDGYWYPNGHRYKWHDGYWTRLPYAGARWIGPRHEGGMFYDGYWEGDRGRFGHDHRWDRERAIRDRDRFERREERRENRR